MFGLPLDALLEEMYGSVARGFGAPGARTCRAVRSKRRATASRARSRRRKPIPRSSDCSTTPQGMHAYVERDYASSVAPSRRVGRQRNARSAELAARSRATPSRASFSSRTAKIASRSRAKRPRCSTASAAPRPGSRRRPAMRRTRIKRRPAPRGSEVEPGRAAADDQREPDDLRLGQSAQHLRIHAQRLDHEPAESVRDQVLAEQERAAIAALPEHERHGQEPQDLVDLGGMDAHARIRRRRAARKGDAPTADRSACRSRRRRGSSRRGRSPARPRTAGAMQFIICTTDTPWMRAPIAPTTVPRISPPYQVIPSRANSRSVNGRPSRIETSIAK